MAKYKVIAEEGIEVNGELKAKGEVVELEEAVAAENAGKVEPYTEEAPSEEAAA